MGCVCNISHLSQIPQLMVTYGKLLMNELPDETTEFISEVCKEKGLLILLPQNVLDHNMNCLQRGQSRATICISL